MSRPMEARSVSNASKPGGCSTAPSRDSSRECWRPTGCWSRWQMRILLRLRNWTAFRGCASGRRGCSDRNCCRSWRQVSNGSNCMEQPYLSIVIPVYNEEFNLVPLMERLYPVVTGAARPFEIIFINDGSRDRSLEILQRMVQQYPGVRVVEFNGNFGQHMAILAAFEISRGEIVITLDADLQNPPEEIPRLIAEIEKGFDVVGTIRQQRQDCLFRKLASRIVNITTNKMTGMKMNDYGCMLRAYHRNIIENINRCGESTTFIPALAQTFASNPTEIEVAHAERAAGESKYSLYKLIRLNFDL